MPQQVFDDGAREAPDAIQVEEAAANSRIVPSQ
jgi:hypothetical protein